MTSTFWRRAFAVVALGLGSAAQAGETDCGNTALPRISFVQFTSPNIATSPPSLLTIKGKLTLPQQRDHRRGCTSANGRKLPAVVILHGSAGVDSRGDFHEAALNAAGIATLQIDMWEARGLAGGAGRPAAPILTIPDAYSALAILAARPEIDAKRIGVVAISLGGYYAPRAAAFEQRFACCIAWGAQWDYWDVWNKRFEHLDAGNMPSLSVPWQHLLWIFNVSTREAAMKCLEGFRLAGVVQKITCPFLMVHGAGDEQIPLSIAHSAMVP